jgi:molybdopterin-binding protein
LAIVSLSDIVLLRQRLTPLPPPISTHSRRRRSNPRSIVDLRQWPKGGPAMKLSARNQIKGKVVEVRKGATTAHVRIDIGNGVVITSSITNEAVDDLGVRVGDEAIAVIKASDVMVAK